MSAFTSVGSEGEKVNPEAFKGALGINNADINAAIAEDPASTRAAAKSQVVEPLVPTPLSIVDDRGGQTITHTSPVYIPEGFAGYRYWMAYTPYPGANEENPRVMASHDGVSWVLPAGMSSLIDTLANAHALGHIGWSDTDLHWDGTKLWLIYRGYGDGATYTTAETIYLRQCTDGINWSARSAIITGVTSTDAKLLSPSLVKLADGTFRIYVVNNATGGMQYFSSTNGTSSWAYVGACSFGQGVSYWHAAVRLYGGRYYAIVNSRRGWALYAYDSIDGITFKGRGKPFVPRTGLSLDAGGNYRSGFYMSGATPPVMNIYAIAMTGSTESILNANKTLRCFIFRKAYEGLEAPSSPFDWDCIQMVDNFVAGQDVSATDATIGDLRWSLYNGVGTGSAVPGGANKGGVFDSTIPGLSCVAIKSGTTSGNITGLQFDHDTAAGGGRFPFSYELVTALTEPTFRVTFRMESVSDSIWIGLGSANLTASPARFVGLQKTAASADWRFCSREAGGSSYDVDSAKAATGGAGKWWRFEMRWTGTLWQMRISNVGAYQDGTDWLDVTTAITAGSGINFGMWTMANSAAASELRVCKFGFRAFTNRY